MAMITPPPPPDSLFEKLQSHMVMLYKVPSSNDLYSSHFDGEKWHGNDKVINLQSDCTPAMCIFNNRLYMVSRDSGKALWVSYYDTRWHGGELILEEKDRFRFQSTISPCLVPFNGTLYLIYSSLEKNICAAWLHQDSWQGGREIKISGTSGTPTTDQGLNAVEFQQKLYIVYKSKDSDDLYTAYLEPGEFLVDGKPREWRGGRKIKDQEGGISPQSNYNPGIAVYKDKLYIVYKGKSSEDLYTAWFSESKWHGNTKIKDQNGGIKPQSNYSPSARVYGNRLYLVYKGGDSNTLWSASYYEDQGVGTWSGNTRVSTAEGISPQSDNRPSLNVLPILPGTRANWLRWIKDDTPIGSINLPGTHDSAAIRISNGSEILHSPYSCHNTTITQQLMAGVRALDVRLKVKGSRSSGYTFGTCHSNFGLGFNLNEYQSFVSLLDECKQFLDENRSEFIAMQLSVDDWTTNRGDKDAACRALSTLLNNTGICYMSGAMPVLGAVRGKIYLFNQLVKNDISLGAPIDWASNITGGLAIDDSAREPGFAVYVQDKWERSSEAEKLGLFTAALSAFNARGGNLTTAREMLLNFANGIQRLDSGVYITGPLLSYFGQWDAPSRPRRLGWSFFDYEDTSVQTDRYGFVNCIQFLVASNFGYPGFEQRFKVIGDGLDQPNYALAMLH